MSVARQILGLHIPEHIHRLDVPEQKDPISHRVHSSERANKEDRGILENLFVDEIREFNEEHNLDGWE